MVQPGDARPRMQVDAHLASRDARSGPAAPLDTWRRPADTTTFRPARAPLAKMADASDEDDDFSAFGVPASGAVPGEFKFAGAAKVPDLDEADDEFRFARTQ